MLVASSQRFLPTTVNTTVLSKDGLYFYVHRDVYDKAVVLSDRHKLDTLWSVLEGQNNNDTVEWFYENAPTPINILAPYISLVEEGIPQDMEVCCGVLHAITNVLDVRGFIQQPQQLRKSVTFSLSVREEYEMAWERFFLQSVNYDERNQIVPYLIAGQAMASGYVPMSFTGQQGTGGGGHNIDVELEPGEYDDGPDKYGPEWTRTGPGVYYNKETGDVMMEEDEDEDADFLDFLNSDPTPAEEAVPPASISSEPTQTSADEKSQTRKLLDLGVD